MDEILMPRLTEAMREGVLLRWLTPDRAVVVEGELIAEIATGDRVEPLEAPRDGLLRHGTAEGARVTVGDPVGTITPPAAGEPAQMGMALQDAGWQEGPVASSTARRAAEELGVDLGTVTGSGPGGRIVRADVEAAAAGAPEQPEPWREPEMDAEPEPRPEPEPEPRPEPEPEPEPEPRPEPEPEPRPEPEPEMDAEPEPLPETGTEAHATPPAEHPQPEPEPSAAVTAQTARSEPLHLERDVDVTGLLRLRDDLARATDGPAPGLDALVVRAITLAARERGIDGLSVEVTRDPATRGPAVLDGGHGVGAIAAAIAAGDPSRAPTADLLLVDLSAGGADRVVAGTGMTTLSMGRVRTHPVIRETAVIPGRVMTLVLTAPAGAPGAADLLARVAELLERPHALVL